MGTLYDIDDLDLTQSSSSLYTPPPVTYPNLELRARAPQRFRRQPTSIADCWSVLTKVFGHSEYKGKQKEIFEAAIKGADVLVIAPTGMGKSICFQVPAVADRHGVTLVVSPLLALMKNQITSLLRKQIPVASLTSETAADDKAEIIQDLSSGHPLNRLVYVTPEKLSTADFMRLLEKVYRQGELNRLVIDEAHCISEWGHDFRDTYRRLGMFREKFPGVPIMALTASATAAVQTDILRSLRMSTEHLFKVVHPFNRANLFYEIQYYSAPSVDARYAMVHAYIDKLHRRRGRASSGIVYCRTRAACTALADFLRRKGMNAQPYHKGMKGPSLDRTLTAWETGGDGEIGGVDVVCATVAFGMGIDKSDVRYVIHFDMPKSFEGYYQETGRAGRDGSVSKCVLFYSREDAISVKRWVASSHCKRVSAADDKDGPLPSQRALQSLSSLIKMADSVDTCRHVAICRYFGETIDDTDKETLKQYCNAMCDVCKTPDKVKQRHMELSTPDWASSQAPVVQDPFNDDDEVSRNWARPSRAPSRTASGSNLDLRPTRPWQDPRLTPAGRETGRDPPSAGSSGGTSLKRSNSMTYGASKKPRTQAPTYHLTSSSGLSKAMKKPFRPPFKTPLQDLPQNVTAPTPAREEHAWDSPDADDTQTADVETLVEKRETTPARSASPTPPASPSPPSLELEAACSQKIDSALRQQAMTSLHRTLWKTFMAESRKAQMWSHLKMGSAADVRREHLLATTAQQVEWEIHSMSTSETGYRARLAGQLEALEQLRCPEAWQDDSASEYEEARDVARAIEELARKSKGKARAAP